jgi:hypothetical protein
MKAVFTDTGALIGEFLIANDLSAVYRIDTENPSHLWVSDSMMAAVKYLVLERAKRIPPLRVHKPFRMKPT